jgi:hypothetical protein
MPSSASLGHPMARHIPLRGGSALASLGMERATRPRWDPLVQSVDKNDTTVNANVKRTIVLLLRQSGTILATSDIVGDT